MDCAGRAAAATALSEVRKDSFFQALPQGGVALCLPPLSKMVVCKSGGWQGWRVALAPFSAPPKHQFQAGAVGIRAWHPLFHQIEMRRKPLPLFVARRAKRRAVRVGNQIIHGEKLPAGFQPTQHSTDVIVAFAWIDGAKQRVLEQPVELN